MKLLRQLYPQFLAALRRIESLERERSVRADLEEFLRRLPLPTIILRWNLKPIYQNKAARDFCAVWEKGPEEAKRTKASSPIPVEILDRCRVLKQKWMDAQRRDAFGATHRTSKKNRCIIRDRRICARPFNSSRSIPSAWRDHIFSSPAKIVAETGNTPDDSGFSGCQASPGSHGANGKLRNWPVKGEATRRLLKTPA